MLVTTLFKKCPVVADQQQRALEIEEQLLQQFEGLDVEVVGGLVQDQDIGGPGEQTRQQQAAALPAGQGLHLGPRPLRREEKFLQVSDHVLG